MLQFTSRDLLSGIAAIAVSVALRNWLHLPGMVAAVLLMYAIVAIIFQQKTVVLRQMLVIAYFCILVEFAWCAAANFIIVSPSFPTHDYWNVTGPITASLVRSALVLVPLLLCAVGIVQCRRSRYEGSRSRLLLWTVIMGTASVLLMYLCLHAVLWFGMAHPSSRGAANKDLPQSRGIHAAVAFVLGATCVPLVESSLVPTSSASFTAATANLPVVRSEFASS